MKKNINIIFILALILFLGIGYFLGKLNSDNKDIYKYKYENALNKYKQSGYYSEEQKSVYGEVISINGNNVEVKVTTIDPFVDSSLDIRNVSIDTNTKIELYKQIGHDELFGEEHDHSDHEEGDEHKESFEIKEVEKSEIKVGNNIDITSGINIKKIKSFTAEKILIQE